MTKPSRRSLILSGLAAGPAAAALPSMANAAPGGMTVKPYSLPKVAAVQPVAETKYGKIRGYRADDVAMYLGIPYGASTAGKNRFLPAKPPTPWAGVRDTINYGLECPESLRFARADPDNGPDNTFLLERDFVPHGAGEDCLRVNVWAPVRSGKRPVIVWMHGGGFQSGSGYNVPAWDGANLADRGDVVVVSHNHRLNLFGYLDLSSFGGQWAQSANIGLQDLVSVLQWVRDNIEAFGGDPNNVTIFGHSGGGMKVSSLLAMPSAHGLYHRAIVTGGSPRAFPGGAVGIATKESAAQTAAEAIKRLNLTPATLDRLADIPLAELVALNAPPRLRWGPNIDGRVLPEEPGVATRTAQGLGVPLLVGTVLNELVAPMDHPKATTFTEADLADEANKAYGASGPAIVRAYRKYYPDLPPLEVWCAIAAAPMREGALQQARNHAKAGGASYNFMFAWRTPVLGGRIGTFHAAELCFIFDRAEESAKQTGGGPEAVALARRMSQAWANFAWTGKPGHAGLPAWPEAGNNDAVMVFDNECRVVPNLEKEGRDLIRAALAKKK